MMMHNYLRKSYWIDGQISEAIKVLEVLIRVRKGQEKFEEQDQYFVIDLALYYDKLNNLDYAKKLLDELKGNGEHLDIAVLERIMEILGKIEKKLAKMDSRRTEIRREKPGASSVGGDRKSMQPSVEDPQESKQISESIFVENSVTEAMPSVYTEDGPAQKQTHTSRNDEITIAVRIHIDNDLKRQSKDTNRPAPPAQPKPAPAIHSYNRRTEKPKLIPTPKPKAKTKPEPESEKKPKLLPHQNFQTQEKNRTKEIKRVFHDVRGDSNSKEHYKEYSPSKRSPPKLQIYSPRYPLKYFPI